MQKERKKERNIKDDPQDNTVLVRESSVITGLLEHVGEDETFRMPIVSLDVLRPLLRTLEDGSVQKLAHPQSQRIESSLFIHFRDEVQLNLQGPETVISHGRLHYHATERYFEGVYFCHASVVVERGLDEVRALDEFLGDVSAAGDFVLTVRRR